jgi:hypothetical protein
MLSQFPARDLDEPVTKEFVQLQIADIRHEIAELRTEMADLGNRLAVRLQITVGIVAGLLAAVSFLTR